MLHRKKLLAIALATAAGLPALVQAQTSNVVLYGKLYPEMAMSRGHGSTAPGTAVSTIAPLPTAANGDTNNIYSMDAANSRLGVRGTENLSSDLKAIFQIEQTIPVDAGGGVLANRDTFVGLESERWGTVKLGNFDTVYKNLGDTLSFLGVSSGNFVSISNTLAKSPLGTSSSASFHLRRANSVQYATPDFRGLGFLIQYSPDEAKTTSRNADLVSTGIKYENGPLYAAVAYERHRDTFGGSRNARSSLSNFSDLNAHSTDDSWRGTLEYKIGQTTIEGNVATTRYDERGGLDGRFGEYRHVSWGIGVDHRMGGWRFAASFARAEEGSCSLLGGADCSTDGLSGNQFNVGAMYYLSRRTQLFALASWLNNGKSARLTTGFVTPTPGTDQDVYALGISHTF